MGHSRRDRGVVEVSLSEDHAPHPERQPHGPEAGSASNRRRRWWLALASVVVAIGVFVVGSVVEDRREDARRAELASIPGVLPHMEGPLEELWQEQIGTEVMADDGVAAFAHAGLLQGVDLASGDVLWSREYGTDEACQSVERVRTPAGSAEQGGGDVARAPEWIACRTVHEVPAEGPEGAGVSTVVVLLVATGTPVAELEVAGSVMAAGGHGPDLFVASSVAGEMQVQRWDVDSGRLVWARPAPEGLAMTIADAGRALSVDDGLLWWGPPGTTALDLETGVELPEEAPAPGGRQVADGGSLVPLRDESHGVAATQVLEPDGALRFEVEAEPWLPPVSDGSADDVITMRRVEAGLLPGSGAVVGVDARTGAIRWEGELFAGVSPRIQVDGVLVAVGGGRAVALEVATGETLWESAARIPPNISTMSDGEVILVPTFDDSTGLVLAAREVRTGEVRWTVSIPEGTLYAGFFGDVVLVRASDGTALIFGAGPREGG
ncbi:PQQ-binding-like beta-propeller repeat protein [Actinotalea sp. C106]|uniref:outer membrane protein assembly factor BamB family protein n=1 Tax=Actinotalea sp. C106 TaxID=2908644 RepID=UPI0020281AB8|nr:PQQ-binding-like beta-propeller repeat protein [Actinotalea sp. C106]